MDRFVLTLFLCLFCYSFGNAQTTIEHIVARGETIQTIAQRYDITVEEIVERNPDAAQLVYVGMKLTIPVHSDKSSSSTSPLQTSTQPISNETRGQKTKGSDTRNTTQVLHENTRSDAYTSAEAYYSFTSLGANYNWTAFGAGVTRTNTLQSFYVPLLLTYGGHAEYFSSDKDYKWTFWGLKIPVSIGYAWDLSPAVSIHSYVGLNVRLFISGTVRGNGLEANLFNRSEMGESTYNRFHLGYQGGFRLYYNRVFLRVEYGGTFTRMVPSIASSIITGSFGLGINF